MESAYFITAIGTPLTEDERLHEEGLEIELNDQWAAGINGILVAGTMGMMQLLTDETYRRLVERSVELSAGKGEILVGVGDAGFARTRDRIHYASQFKVDAVAVLSPYFIKYSQPQLVDYFKALADVSSVPVYMYDLPVITGIKLSLETILELAKHPNIHGIKASCELAFTRQLIDLADDDFRVIVARPELGDLALRHGITQQLDGMWTIAPRWTVAIGRAAAAGDWEAAAEYQRRVYTVRNLLVKYGIGAFTAMMNARGIPGIFTPQPTTPMCPAEREKLLDEPIMKKLVEEDPAKGL